MPPCAPWQILSRPRKKNHAFTYALSTRAIGNVDIFVCRCEQVINGFYMAMREKYTKPGASIHYYLVEWDSSNLSWSDFRGKTLGCTDPTTADAGSLRRSILEQWKSLGLASEPNVGDNGVHASASPFEAMAERINWCAACGRLGRILQSARSFCACSAFTFSHVAPVHLHLHT